MDKRLTIQKALEIIPYKSLFDLACEEEKKPAKPSRTPVKTSSPDPSVTPEIMLSQNATMLAYDMAQIPASTYRDTGGRLGLSNRRLGKARDELVSLQMALEVWVGGSLYLAPTEQLYERLSLESPYKRNVSTEHSFLSLVTEKLIQIDPLIQKTVIEVPTGNIGCTVDLMAYLKNGGRWSFEITLSCSNVAANAAKLRNKGFSKIVFVCRDDQLRRSVQTILRDVGFEPEFFALIECTIFSVLMKAYKRSTRKGKK